MNRMQELPVITGQLVVLRPITDGDTGRIVTWRNTPSVMQNFIFREKFTPEMHRHWLATKVATGQVVQYIIEDKTDGRPVGSVYYRDVDHANRSAEYGIFIGEESARGKGFGTETARLFTDFGFTTLGLHRISLRLLAENLPARRSYEKAGFVLEGICRDMVVLDGQYRDVVFMAKLAGEGRNGDRTE
ncbi:GNAT family N-acetyltransferase [Subdoligranulum variabile]|nr:GNAT family protein [Subdoligranulum variabile]UWP69062.1 GNAT family N-acetyltransferase [Subdoligranulum variabile]